MRIIKLYRSGAEEPLIARFHSVYRGDKKSLKNHILISYPLDRPPHRRFYFWVDLADIHIDWVRSLSHEEL